MPRIDFDTLLQLGLALLMLVACVGLASALTHMARRRSAQRAARSPRRSYPTVSASEQTGDNQRGTLNPRAPGRAQP